MSPSLVVLPNAEADIDDAAIRYERESEGLGIRFLAAVDTLLFRIAEAPRQFPIIDDPVRRGLLYRFPFGVYFAQDGHAVSILAVLHLHRRPGSWRRHD